MWQVGILLLLIITTGQYLAAWGSYFERKLSLVRSSQKQSVSRTYSYVTNKLNSFEFTLQNEYVESSLKKTRRSKKAQKEGPKIEEVQAELEEQFLQKPRY